MSDYTPTTDEVRDRYAWGRSDVGYVSYDEAEAEFNQWLAEHDAEREGGQCAMVSELAAQARAEAKKRWPEPRSLTRGGMVVGFEEGATWAATRARTITTVDQLDALPIGSVVLSEQGAVFEHDHDGFWAEPGFTWRPMSKDMALPARVLYNPEETR